MTETIICAWCLKAFEWTRKQPTDASPLYCTKNHKKRASAASVRFRSWFQPGACPTPSKRAFDTPQQADAWRRAFPEQTALNRPYGCACGKFHLGRVRRDVHAVVGAQP